MTTGPGRSSLPVMRMESPVEQMAPAVAPGPARYVAATWTVRPGDNLWSMAATTLSRAWGRAPTDAEVDRYWTVLIGANRERLAHPGLPDLIFAGQVFALPPTPAPSEAGA